ncbi:hypothetical protein CETAM_06280 [Corynebacterium comes]|uniref:Uncharacterized protein n=1 Tax=Corynebacterium comes TaxID=2675218 RepID=A0A6B8VN16_9CORY|nr:hypothetical protein CETAM_06280 [Corynebacterium comes]
MNPGDLARVQKRAEEGLSPGDVEKQLADILGEETTSLAGEADQLTRAHAVLHRALQDNG